MNRLFRLSETLRHDPEIDAWMRAHTGELGRVARHWFDVMRGCGDDVRETMHDGQPTACVADAAFAYVDVFTAHVNVGFFHGAELGDQLGLLEGRGKHMRHVKVRPDDGIDAAGLTELIESAHALLAERLAAE